MPYLVACRGWVNCWTGRHFRAADRTTVPSWGQLQLHQTATRVSSLRCLSCNVQISCIGNTAPLSLEAMLSEWQACCAGTARCGRVPALTEQCWDRHAPQQTCSHCLSDS